MEHQQHQHLQQLVNLDSLENSNARALVLKLINVVLTILQVCNPFSRLSEAINSWIISFETSFDT